MAKGSDAYRTISEVSKWLGTQSHVLRYWESKFDVISPMKSSGGRRYYRPEDMQVIGGIRQLLHVDGMTIKAVQALIAAKGTDPLVALSPPLPGGDTDTADNDANVTVPDPDVSAETKTPRHVSKQTKVDRSSAPAKGDNVIAFTIDPLPMHRGSKPKPVPAPDDAPVPQMSLFPDIDTPDDGPRRLTPNYIQHHTP
ncbi:MAG: MerR family transcriptional regulator, partial [Pseudomonadota bacterium]